MDEAALELITAHQDKVRDYEIDKLRGAVPSGPYQGDCVECGEPVSPPARAEHGYQTCIDCARKKEFQGRHFATKRNYYGQQ